MEANPSSVKFAADFGNGQQAEVEFPTADALWVAAGSGIEIADIWLKDVAGLVDLRVRIMRLGNAIELSVDRGEQSPNWWEPEAAPRLLVALDPAQGHATATASVGSAGRVRSMGLGQVNY